MDLQVRSGKLKRAGNIKHMKSGINHLPEEKQRELRQITEILRAQEGVEMVILFGSYARGDWREERELEPGRWSGHASDYDILVVVGEAVDGGFEHTIKRAVNASRFSAYVNPIVHDIEDVNSQLEDGRYFFLDIKREGYLLYDSGDFSLAEPRQLKADERRSLAQADFDYWYDRAAKFYKGYGFYLSEGELLLAAFSLNQVAECAYKTILLVFTGYCPHEHMLELLGAECSKFGPVFRELFPIITQEERDRFTLLDHAYIGARYIKEFTVSQDDLAYLAPRLKRLLETTESICRQKIDSLASE